MVDTPTNNFATWNPLDETTTGLVYSEGNTKARPATGNNHLRSNPTMFSSSGKWYAEFIVTSGYSSDSVFIGIIKESAIHRDSNNDALWHTQDGAIGYEVGGTLKVNTSTISTGGTTWTTGDVMSVALDMDNQKLYLGKNGSWFNSANPVGGTGYIYNSGILSDGSWGFTLNGYGSISGNETTWVANFGQDSSFAGNKIAQGKQDGNEIGDFYYTPPSGFLALCTANLPDPTVIPSEHFNTVTYTGNNTSSLAVTGVGFQPDWVWIKNRSIARNHGTYDAIRGATKDLIPNDTGAESTRSTGLTAFNSDGFSLGSHNNVNEYTASFVAWNWKAGNATLGTGDFTQGTIASTCSRNVDAGFSIVSYTGNQTASATVGHGLSKAPEMVIIKNRDAAGYGWLVGHDAITWEKYVVLNTTAALNVEDVFNDTAPTASVFSPGGTTFGNKTGDDIIAYCFHSVDGYSKCGSYTGNGSTDGTFVYTGFRPAMIIAKRSTSVEDWQIIDTTRASYNVADIRLNPNNSNAEVSNTNGGDRLDILSNGFKGRDPAGQWNTSGSTYIYIAFAEQPFKHSNAR
jgi:hypothetical protein